MEPSTFFPGPRVGLLLTPGTSTPLYNCPTQGPLAPGHRWAPPASLQEARSPAKKCWQEGARSLRPSQQVKQVSCSVCDLHTLLPCVITADSHSLTATRAPRAKPRCCYRDQQTPSVSPHHPSQEGTPQHTLPPPQGFLCLPCSRLVRLQAGKSQPRSGPGQKMVPKAKAPWSTTVTSRPPAQGAQTTKSLGSARQKR